MNKKLFLSVISAMFFMAGMMPLSLHAQQWVRSYRSARKQALRQNKKLFIFFSGSDWCMESRQLAMTLFRKKAFRDLVRDKYVLYNADFPRHKVLGQEAEEYNKSLAARYGITSYPAIVLADPRHGGVLVKHTSIRETTPGKLFETLETAAGLRKKAAIPRKKAAKK